MFTNINLKEAVLLAKTINQTAKNTQEVLEDMTLIDDLLSIMKSKSLMNKRHKLKNQLSARIAISVGDKNVMIGGNNQNYF